MKTQTSSARPAASAATRTTLVLAPSAPRGKHAIVMGGSMAGLMTARVLSELFEQVTILEKDAIRDVETARKGVPQGRQLHALLKRGELILAELFPGIVSSLQEKGAIYVDFGTDLAWYHFGAWKSRTAPGLTSLSVPRPVLEAEVRRRVLALPNVSLRQEVSVRALLRAPSEARITGVRIHPVGHPHAEEQLRADLVVDASGRGSRLPQWLEELNLGRVPETTLTVDVGYATRSYRIPKDTTIADKGIYVLGSAPDSKRLGILIQGGEDHWIVCASGLLGDHPPTDEKGFLEFLRDLPRPDIYEAIKDAEPMTPIEPYKFKSHLRHHYDQLPSFPDGLVVLGDAHASFNPIYGQGMTTAALSVLELQAQLRKALAQKGKLEQVGLSRRIQQALAKVVEGPWGMSTGEDLRFPEVEGKRPLGSSFMQWYSGRLHRLSQVDADINERFIRIMNMLDSPARLFSPSVIMKVLRPIPKPTGGGVKRIASQGVATGVKAA